jgi:hypothetical protein
MRDSSDMTESSTNPDFRSRVLQRIQSDPNIVWTPADFADLGGRAAVDKVLQRLAAGGQLRRIDRGLYDRPRRNKLTGHETVPDYREVIRAVTRRDQARFVVDGMTAANDLGLTTAVPARIEVLTDARLKRIKLGAQEIHFKPAAPSRLYWAGRPAMRIVQALHWMQDVLANSDERERVARRLHHLFADPEHGPVLRDDLRQGFSTLPIWMQDFLREFIWPGPQEGRT